MNTRRTLSGPTEIVTTSSFMAVIVDAADRTYTIAGLEISQHVLYLLFPLALGDYHDCEKRNHENDQHTAVAHKALNATYYLSIHYLPSLSLLRQGRQFLLSNHFI